MIFYLFLTVEAEPKSNGQICEFYATKLTLEIYGRFTCSVWDGLFDKATKKIQKLDKGKIAGLEY